MTDTTTAEIDYSTDLPVLQGLMHTAYDKWQGNSWSYEQFLSEITPRELQAVVLGNWNYQVENGGIVQWCDNGYHVGADVLLALLASIGSPLTMRVRGFVQEGVDWQEAREDHEHERRYRSSCRWDDDDEGEYDEDYDATELDRLTDLYYTLNGDFMREVEAWMVDQLWHDKELTIAGDATALLLVA